MSILSTIFNPSILFFLGFTLLIVALLVVYFENKMREQNHKISSMLSLVSSLAEETNVIKTHLNYMNNANNTRVQYYESNNNPEINNLQNNKYLDKSLISVSDEDDEEDDDEEDDDEEDDDEEDDDEEDDDEEDDDEEDDDEDQDEVENTIKLGVSAVNQNDIKVLNLDDNDYFTLNNTLEKVDDNNDNYDDNYDNDNDDDNDDDDDLDDINFNKLSDNDSVSDDKKTHIKNQNNETENHDQINFRTINISNLEENNKNMEIMDYKKLSLNKLKSIVLEKGLITDPSKLKKHELLKLLIGE
jgi:hypothetical protein